MEERTEIARRGDCGSGGLLYERTVLEVWSLPRLGVEREEGWVRLVAGSLRVQESRVVTGAEEVTNVDLVGAEISKYEFNK